jgi:hypothetical protein
MKKAVFIAVLGAASVVASHAQGILFNNYNNSVQTTGITFASGPLAGQGVGSEFSAQLLYGAAGDTLISQLVPLGSPVTFVTSLGYSALPSGSPIYGNPASNTGAGWFGNAQVNFPAYNTAYAMAYSWTGTYLGVTYNGVSPIAVVTTPASSSSPALNLPPSLRATTFTSTPVPEPTTLALAALGGLASLVAFRRKQA